jgi:hypothetical protein
MKTLTILIILVIITTELLSANDNIDRVNETIKTLHIQKITVQGVDGFFIPLTGHKNLLYILNDYIYLQDLLVVKDQRIAKLEKLEVKNFRLKTALGVSISFDIGSLFLCAGLGILCYNLALEK